ncbi:GAF domain-containing protein [Flexithrix dorotheae]|uniref:GAF domain-containing protein n=1 Tax=Flexithrix dorotheae TaxID=70993 RepID=UPI000375DEB8|nr:GAF domain-containing protein [Flexithrix dorotheae]
MIRFPYKIIKRENLQNLSLHLESLSTEINAATEFVKNIENGKLNTTFEGFENDESNLISALIKMQQHLQKIAEEEKERNWSTEGLANFVEILRNNHDNDLSVLCDEIISSLVKYMGANQGGLFIVNEEDNEDKYLEMVACYAYDRKKYINKRLDIGEGIVGQAYLERESIFLTEVPESFVNITSGLGEASPRSILIVPLKVNDEVFGILELASFKKFEKHEIDFLEKLGENIASSIATTKVNERTKRLLQESQMQTEQMRAQEEEMRQNNEELVATQEEMQRNQKEIENALSQTKKQAEELREKEEKIKSSQEMLQAIIDHIPQAIFWKDKDLKYIGCNKLFATTAGLSSPKDVIGKDDFDLLWGEENAKLYREDDAKVIATKKAKLGFEEKQNNTEGDDRWLRTSKIPLLEDNGSVRALLGIFEDVTEAKNREIQLEEQRNELEVANKKMSSNELVMKKALEKAREFQKQSREAKQNNAISEGDFKALKENEQLLKKNIAKYQEREQELLQKLQEKESEIENLKTQIQKDSIK